MLLPLLRCCCLVAISTIVLGDVSRPEQFLEKLKEELHIVNETEVREKVSLPATWDKTAASSWTHPVVLEQHKLLFCAMPKCGSTQWRKMLRRLNGASNYLKKEPHNPATNGLTQLNHLPVERVQEIINDPTYTKAVFVRSPMTRVLSGFRDKIESRHEFHRAPIYRRFNASTMTFAKFMEQVSHQSRDVGLDEHWRRESAFCGMRFFDYDFVGYFENIEEDSRHLLQQLGLYDKYGASGWGKSGQDHFLKTAATSNMATLTGSQNAKVLAEYYDPKTLELLNNYYDEDFRRFKFHKFSHAELVKGDISSFREE